MRHLLTKLCFLTIALLQLTPLSAKQADSQTAIHVGVYAPFSNEKAFIGRSILGNLESARDELQNSGIQYSFYTLDKLPASADESTTLQKFINTHQIKIILTEGEESGKLVAPLAKKYNIIHFNLASNESVADGQNNFVASNPAFEKALAEVIEIKKNQALNARSNTRQYIQHVFNNFQANSPVIPVFHLFNQSLMLALKTNPQFKTDAVSEQIQVLATAEKNNSAKTSG